MTHEEKSAKARQIVEELLELMDEHPDLRGYVFAILSDRVCTRCGEPILNGRTRCWCDFENRSPGDE